MGKRNEIELVEEWLSAFVDRGVRPVLAEAGYALPGAIIFDHSFPSQGKRKPGRGEWWEGPASTNGVPRMIVPCDTADVETITDNIVYLGIFGAVGVKDGHGRAFNNCARRIGMDGPLPKCIPGPRLRERLNEAIADMPPFPRGALKFNKFKPSGEERNVAGRAAPQRGRMIKAECLLCSDEGSEYIARLSAQALREKGPPVCPVHKTPMWHAELPPLPGQGDEPAGKRPVTLPEPELIEHQPVLAIEFKGDELVKNPGFAGAVAGTALVWLALKAAGVEYDASHAGAGVIAAYVIGINAGGCCGLALKRGLRGGASGFWQTTVGRYLIGRMAGTAVYTALTMALWKPAIAAVVYSFTGLGHTIGWQAVAAIIAAIAPALPWLPWGLAAIGAWFLRTPAKMVIGRMSRPFRRFYRSLRMGQGGSAGFAGICEEWANRYRPGMIFLGHSLFDRRWPVGMRDDRMLQTLAGTGAGKGESAIINNVLLHNGSLFVVDFKGQIASVTAEALRAKGYTVHIIDHLNVLKNGTACIDPLADLDPEAVDYVERVKKIVDAMTIPTGERNRFFEEGGKTLCEGAIDYLIRRAGEEFVPPEEFEQEEITSE